MKKYLLVIVIMLCSAIGFCQQELQVQSNEKGLYVSHTVAVKENFYSVGRLYNISPKEIAAFNGLDMTKGLEVGQTVKIPLQAANFSQTADQGTPVYYVVGDKEGLYRVSLKNNKVLMANLRKWNHLSNDKISAGTKLIVGYLTLSETQNSSANSAVASVPQNSTATNTTSSNQSNTTDNNLPKADKPVEIKHESEKTVAKTTPANNPVSTASVMTSDAGYFKSQYDQQAKATPPSKDQTVTAGIFKTASGWQDSKYYALMDGIEPGSIVHIINPTNNKTIYAKVLGQMSGIRQNQGLELRISNAGATALDVTDTEKFIVRVVH